VLAPGLQVVDNAFVIPQGSETQMVELIRKDRRMQKLSAILTVVGALGLAFHYRHVFAGARSP
jgi:hypothetical protein